MEGMPHIVSYLRQPLYDKPCRELLYREDSTDPFFHKAPSPRDFYFHNIGLLYWIFILFFNFFFTLVILALLSHWGILPSHFLGQAAIQI